MLQCGKNGAAGAERPEAAAVCAAASRLSA